MRDGRTAPRTALAAAAMLLFAMLALFVRAGWTQAADAALIDGVRGAGGASLLAPIRLLTDLGGLPVVSVVAVLIVLVLAFSGERSEAARLFVIVGGGRIAVELIKLAVARARPPLIDQAVAVHSFSFPSSHAANATIGYCAIAFAVTHANARRHWRPALLILAALLGLSIGLSRVWLGVHWPVDVVAGWLFAIGWLAVCAAVPRGESQ